MEWRERFASTHEGLPFAMPSASVFIEREKFIIYMVPTYSDVTKKKAILIYLYTFPLYICPKKANNGES